MNEPLSFALPPIDLHWAIEPRWAMSAKQELERIDWSAHVREWQEAESRRGESDPDDKPYEMADGVAVLNVTGAMTKRPQSWGRGTSTVQMRRLVRTAMLDPDVRSIALIIDSPGGQVSGTFDLAQDIARAAQRKPVVAYLEDLAASAAYALASQATAIYANGNALVGSIGTYMVIEDYSAAAEKAGVKVHVIRAGEFKGAGTMGTELTKKQIGNFQREVESLNEVFLSTVARGRGMDLEDVRGLADGRVYVASEALEKGLIDGVRSFDAVLDDLQAGRIGVRPQTAALSGQERGKPMSLWDQLRTQLGGGPKDEDTSQNAASTGNGAAVVDSGSQAQANAQAAAQADQARREAEQARQEAAAARQQAYEAQADAFVATEKAANRLIDAQEGPAKALYAALAADDHAQPLANGAKRTDLFKAYSANQVPHNLLEEQAKDTPKEALVLENRLVTAGVGDEEDARIAKQVAANATRHTNGRAK